jgi:hypothetical protein
MSSWQLLLFFNPANSRHFTRKILYIMILAATRFLDFGNSLYPAPAFALFLAIYFVTFSAA